jgi:4-diphosphocytidyl-2-C-methyl-D-erythritol kinase
MQAGLGGGSANAATTMYAFNKLSGNPVDNDSLRSFGGEIGSDISFFFSSGTAFCTGRGEHIKSLVPLPKYNEVVIDIFKINEGLSTAKVFQNLDLNNLNHLSPTILLDSFSEMGILDASIDGKLINDLQAPALISSPQLRSLIDALRTIPIFELVTMSGSGTALCCFRNKADYDDEGNRKVQTCVNTLCEEYPGLQHFQCFPIVKTDTADSWYF